MKFKRLFLLVLPINYLLAEKSTFDAIELSEKPIAITHANPTFWHAAKRNESNFNLISKYCLFSYV